jgi:tetratricopeptide (TPR) repeat protein
VARSPFEREDRIPQIAATRYFTNREAGIEAFARAIHTATGEKLRALVFYGVGGIGKSALLHRLRETLPEGLPAALVDLQAVGDRTRAYREVLLKLRLHFGAFRLDFPRFDLCLGVMLAHEGDEPPPLIRADPKLSATFKLVYEMVKIVPVVGPAATLLQAATGWAASFPAFQDLIRRAGGMDEIFELRRRAEREDPDLPAELIKRFAWDLSEHLPRERGCRAVLFFDTYEHLWAGRDSNTALARQLDWWVRDLVRYCLDPAVGVLPVIAGRDRLRWEDDDGDAAWGERLDQHLLGGLSAEDAQTFLARCGIGKPMGEPASPLQAAIIQCCDTVQGPEVGCHPLYLALCADIAVNTRRTTGKDPAPATFAGIPTPRLAAELATRFLTSLHSSAAELWVVDLSLTPRFDEDAALALAQARRHAVGRSDWERLKDFSFLEPQADGFYRIHALMRAALRARVQDEAARPVHEWFEAFWTERALASLAWFHRWTLAPADALVEWKAQHDDVLKQLRIGEARELLTRWSEVPLDEGGRTMLGDVLWAATHGALAEALTRTPLAPRQDALMSAIGHFQSCLLVFTETNQPAAWATTQSSLGVAYAALPTGDRDANLRRAIACYEAALRVHTQAEFPRDWANVHNNLGVAYSHLSTGDRAENLSAAIVHYEAALQVCSESDVPEQWATVQNNLGTAYRDLPSDDGAENTRRAIACFEAALRVNTEAASPLDWAMIQSNLALTYGSLQTGDESENQRRAIEHINAAQRVYTEIDFPEEWASSQNNLALVYLALSDGDRAENMRRAIEAFDAALRVFAESDFPGEWAVIQNNLGKAHRDLPAGDRATNLRTAIDHHHAALRVQTEAADPSEWAETQSDLSRSLLALGELTGDLDAIRRAHEHAAAALRGYASVGLDQEAGDAAQALARIDSALRR